MMKTPDSHYWLRQHSEDRHHARRDESEFLGDSAVMLIPGCRVTRPRFSESHPIAELSIWLVPFACVIKQGL